MCYDMAEHRPPDFSGKFVQVLERCHDGGKRKGMVEGRRALD
jgi:hypothetical protein